MHQETWVQSAREEEGGLKAELDVGVSFQMPTEQTSVNLED